MVGGGWGYSPGGTKYVNTSDVDETDKAEFSYDYLGFWGGWRVGWSRNSLWRIC